MVVAPLKVFKAVMLDFSNNRSGGGGTGRAGRKFGGQGSRGVGGLGEAGSRSVREAVREHLTWGTLEDPREDIGLNGAASPSCLSLKLKFANLKLTPEAQRGGDFQTDIVGKGGSHGLLTGKWL